MLFVPFFPIDSFHLGRLFSEMQMIVSFYNFITLCRQVELKLDLVNIYLIALVKITVNTIFTTQFNFLYFLTMLGPNIICTAITN